MINSMALSKTESKQAYHHTEVRLFTEFMNELMQKFRCFSASFCHFHNFAVYNTFIGCNSNYIYTTWKFRYIY